jgi:hypothetical protein
MYVCIYVGVLVFGPEQRRRNKDGDGHLRGDEGVRDERRTTPINIYIYIYIHCKGYEGDEDDDEKQEK